MTPTQRSLAKLRAEGYQVAIVEHWNSFAKIRQDAFGWMDLLAFKGDVTLGVQTTTGSNASKRVAKILESELAKDWHLGVLRAVVVHSWRKVGARGKRKLWECREIFPFDSQNEQSTQD